MATLQCTLLYKHPEEGHVDRSKGIFFKYANYIFFRLLMFLKDNFIYYIALLMFRTVNANSIWFDF